MRNFFIIAIVVLIIIDIVLNVANIRDRQELKELQVRLNKKPAKATKEELKLYEIFCDALNKGTEIDFSGVKCKLIGFGRFSADGEIYDLNIENFLKVLKGE